jgi:hypothetical protein
MGIPYLVERWSQDDFDVVEDGVIVGRVFQKSADRAARPPLDVGERPQRSDTPRGPTANEATREEAMAAFAQSWRRK